MSLPVTVTTNSSQDPECWASIMRDNTFFENDRIPFDVPDKIPWSQLQYMLQMRFYYQTGCNLTESNLHYLCNYSINCQKKKNTVETFQ